VVSVAAVVVVGIALEVDRNLGMVAGPVRAEEHPSESLIVVGNSFHGGDWTEGVAYVSQHLVKGLLVAENQE